MNGVGPLNNFANAISPFSPVGKQAVGEENTESKTSTFKPVVESADTNKSENRTDKGDPDKLIDRADQSVVEEKDEDERSSAQARQDEAQDAPQEAPDEPSVEPRPTPDNRVELQQQNQVEERVAPSVGQSSITSPTISDDPQANLKEAQAIRSAVLALADPSPEDRRVAARAVQLEVEARRELAEQERQERLEEREARLERQEQLRKEEQEREERTQDIAQEAQQREQAFNSTRARNLDLNQRLIDIGVQRANVESGSVVSESV